MSAEYLLLLKFLCTYIFFRFILDKKCLLSKKPRDNRAGLSSGVGVIVYGRGVRAVDLTVLIALISSNFDDGRLSLT